MFLLFSNQVPNEYRHVDIQKETQGSFLSRYVLIPFPIINFCYESQTCMFNRTLEFESFCLGLYGLSIPSTSVGGLFLSPNTL